jgi:uncharacterized tellurite resistance protein B-like protein
MELDALNHDERLALVALLEWIVKSDVRWTGDEHEATGRIIDAFGAETSQALADEVGTRFANDADLRAFLDTIARQESRELIYGKALEVAMADSVDVRESEMLDWLRELWGIEVRIDDGGSTG